MTDSKTCVLNLTSTELHSIFVALVSYNTPNRYENHNERISYAKALVKVEELCQSIGVDSGPVKPTISI